MENRLGNLVLGPVYALLGTLRDGFHQLMELPRNIKQALLLSLDMLFVFAAVYAAVALRYGDLQWRFGPLELTCILVTVIASAAIFLRQGLYRAVVRFMGQQAIWAIITAVTYSSLVLAAAVFLTRSNVPRSLPFIYWGLAMVLIGGSRLLVRAWFQARLRSSSENVIIYGAGASGRQLLTALNHGDQYRAVAFVDDDPRLQNSVINGLQVAHPEELEQLIQDHNISQLLLAIPGASAERRKAIIDSLVGLPVYVRTIPRISELLNGHATVNQIRDVELDDLLGREPVPPHPELVEQCITDKVVMVTGAGGSIGSELCRQILQSGPRELLLLDNSEYALYNIERELREVIRLECLDVEIAVLLGSVQNGSRLEKVFRSFGVQTVYHAAAYKHVPMVEHNIVEGIANNVLGTWSAAQAAHRAEVETFVLVSTDKAVRPTNIMGASKRFAEMILQGLAQRGSGTRFCMVRFGNVLGSSGSVVPLFREQIARGGPVTVTHPEVSRYFMSIAEAAQLVLQASAMGTGGDVFVLNMGEPVRIVELARRMIRLSGYEMNHDTHIGEHIEIEYIGLRPGEKLKEELLLGTRVTGTGHPMIMRAQEECLDYDEIRGYIEQLERFCDNMDCGSITAVLETAVSGYRGPEVRYDHVWNRRNRWRRVAFAGASNVQELFPEKS